MLGGGDFLYIGMVCFNYAPLLPNPLSARVVSRDMMSSGSMIIGILL